MKEKNAANRNIETEIAGRKFKPYNGGKKYNRNSKVVKNLTEALKKSGLKNGMTISFHHQLRNGDFVINKTLEAIKDLGVKDIRMAQTALFDVHEPLIDYIKDRII